jgi:hypothetical protein
MFQLRANRKTIAKSLVNKIKKENNKVRNIMKIKIIKINTIKSKGLIA